MFSNIISGFPGVGKSTLVKNNPSVLDSDSSTFDKKEFPSNYLKHINKVTEEGKIILISSHKEVRQALYEKGILFNLVYPNIGLKDEYLQRYVDRGSSEFFIKLMDENWNSFVQSCMIQKGCNHIVLNRGCFIPDLDNDVYNNSNNVIVQYLVNNEVHNKVSD